MKNQKLLLQKMSGVSLMLLLFLFFSNCAGGGGTFSTDVWNITYDDHSPISQKIFVTECMLPINGKGRK